MKLYLSIANYSTMMDSLSWLDRSSEGEPKIRL
jgi:hypothetical protein